MSHPKVSICCITYNHEQFISQALDSFLMQETDFPFEIVIGDDCSTDNTPRIIEQYRQKYPDIIRVLERKKNLGSEINFVKTIEACRGEYVALCEGDDFWTDPKKIQKQVEILNKELDCSIITTKYSIVNSYGNKATEVNIFPELKENSELVIKKENIFSPYVFKTLTVMFRKRKLNNLIFGEKKCGDVMLVADLLTNGFGIYLNSDTASYRIHDGGIYSMKNDLDRSIIEFNRSQAMSKYFKNNYNTIKNLHKWNTIKLSNELKKSNISFWPRLILLIKIFKEKL